VIDTFLPDPRSVQMYGPVRLPAVAQDFRPLVLAVSIAAVPRPFGLQPEPHRARVRKVDAGCDDTHSMPRVQRTDDILSAWRVVAEVALQALVAGSSPWPACRCSTARLLLESRFALNTLVAE